MALIGSTRRPRRGRLGLALSTAVVTSVLLSSLVASPVAAATTVSVGCRSGVGNVSRLVQAVTDANNRSGATIINLGTGCTYTFFRAHSFPRYGANALPVVHKNLTINGHGSEITRANGVARFRLMAVDPGVTLNLNDLMLSNGRARNGKEGASHFGGAGENGTPGRHGGAIFSRGTLNIDSVTFFGNRAGNGGKGGWSIGIDGNDGDTAGENGDDGALAEGGWGGNGGNGGAIYSTGTLNVIESSFQQNYAGNGGLGGDAFGGDGGDGYPNAPGGNGGQGGGANAGQGGDGGHGGAIYSSGPLTVTQSTFNYNHAGDGVAMGQSVGGRGGDGADEQGDGGQGGGANAFFGGFGGNGGAVYQLGSTVSVTNSTITNNSAGDGGDANAVGGNGGNGGCGGNGGSGGGAVSSAGTAGFGTVFGNGAVVTTSGNVTSANTDGTGGGSSAAGGAGGAGGGGCV